MSFFENIIGLSWISGAIALAAAFVVAVILAIVLVRKMISRKTLQANHDVTGFVFTNLGVLFSVLLGFTVVNVQQRFDKIKETAQVEASFLADLYHGAEVFSEKDMLLIRGKIKNYIHNVIVEEWPMMAKKEPSMHTIKALRELWSSYYKVKLDTEIQKIWYQESIRKLNQLVDTRLARILGAEESLGAEMWTFLFLGAVILVLFIALFGLENIRTHIFLGAILALSTAFLLFLIHSLDTAFTGTIQVPPEALERILKTLP